MEVTKKERGWGGHFICSDRCLFRRNTLIEGAGQSIIVSTVGGMRFRKETGLDTIGAGGRYYETMAFKAKKEGPYIDADVTEEVPFENEWAICAEKWEDLPDDVDNRANDMHDKVVQEIYDKLVNASS